MTNEERMKLRKAANLCETADQNDIEGDYDGAVQRYRIAASILSGVLVDDDAEARYAMPLSDCAFMHAGRMADPEAFQ